MKTFLKRIYSGFSNAWGRLSLPWHFAITSVLLARLFYTLWSFAVFSLFPVAIQNINLSGKPVLTVFDLRISQRYIYSRVVDEGVLAFRPVNGNFVRDTQTDSVWELSSGKAVKGPLAGSRLQVSTIPVESIFPYKGVEANPTPLLAVWQHFDANWYLSIAQNGYGQFPDDTHFAPLYPLLIRLFYPLVGDWLVTGLIIAQLAIIWLVKVLYEVFDDWGGKAIARKSVFLMLIFPSAFFLFSAYAEPLFILTAVLALEGIHSRRWMLAGFWTACAILSRVQGVVLVLPLAYALWKVYRLNISANHFKAFIFPGLATVAYITLRIVAGAPSVIPVNEPSVAAKLVWPWNNFVDAFRLFKDGAFTYINVVNLVLTLLIVTLLIYGWKKIPIEYSLYSIACILILVMREVETQPLNPMIRYALTIPPVFYMLGKFSQNPWINRLILIISLLLGLYLSAQFFMWGFVA